MADENIRHTDTGSYSRVVSQQPTDMEFCKDGQRSLWGSMNFGGKHQQCEGLWGTTIPLHRQELKRMNFGRTPNIVPDFGEPLTLHRHELHLKLMNFCVEFEKNTLLTTLRPWTFWHVSQYFLEPASREPTFFQHREWLVRAARDPPPRPWTFFQHREWLVRASREPLSWENRPGSTSSTMNFLPTPRMAGESLPGTTFLREPPGIPMNFLPTPRMAGESLPGTTFLREPPRIHLLDHELSSNTENGWWEPPGNHCLERTAQDPPPRPWHREKMAGESLPGTTVLREPPGIHLLRHELFRHQE